MWIPLLWLVVLTFVPGLELRASIPFGFFGPYKEAIPIWMMVLICFSVNILVGILVFELMGPVVGLFRKWRWFDEKIWPFFVGKQKKLHPYVEKYGEWGLALFIGIPLPGTGAYSGGVGAFLLGFDRRRFHIANFFGVLLACVCVTALCVLIDRGAVSEDSLLKRIFLNEKAEKLMAHPETIPAE